MWENRADAYTIVVNDSSLLEDARKLTMKNAKKKKFNQKFLIKKLCPSDTTECVVLTRGKYEKGDDVNVDATGWNKGIGDVYNENGKPAFVFINSIVNPEVKKLNETRGIVTADYQKYLEDKWIEELKSKYVVSVNRDLLKKIKN
jgi:peptidyl-prolyl cis-trans isomerase SurA